VTNSITVKPRLTPSELKAKIEQALVRSAQTDAQRITVEVRGSKVILNQGGHVMGIKDKVGALLPWRSERQAPPPGRAGVLAFHDDLDRWLRRSRPDQAPHLNLSSGGVPRKDTPWAR
jgi:hypothetical protein